MKKGFGGGFWLVMDSLARIDNGKWDGMICFGWCCMVAIIR